MNLAALGAVWRREFDASIGSALGWTAAGAFVIALHGLFFFLGFPIGELQQKGFWAAGLASLAVAFAWLPLLLIGLAPALSMSAWAEERKNGTEELLLAWPVPAGSAVLGKFFAGWALLSVVLLLAFVPLAGVVDQLGNLDRGATAGGVFGALLLGGACLSLGHLISALCRDQLVAFLMTALALGALWGFGQLALYLPPQWAELAWFVSPQAHFLDTFARGLFDARDLFFFGSWIAVCLIATRQVVEARRWG